MNESVRVELWLIININIFFIGNEVGERERERRNSAEMAQQAVIIIQYYIHVYKFPCPQLYN